MKRNAISILMLTILVMQPLLVMGIGLPGSESVTQTEKPFAMAQEPGSRLEPGEYTPHVPIAIDETSDFETQGWPGSGTPGDPYVISELNITYDVNEFLISIVNTNASFVIRDCYLDQGSLEWAIRFANTTAATIEYTTIDSAQGGVYLENSNNTHILHADMKSHTSNSDVAYTLLLEQSIGCSLENNRLESEYRVVFGVESNNLTLTQNTLYGKSGWHIIVLSSCNYTTSSSDTLYGGYKLTTARCHHLSFDNLHIDARGGLSVFNGTDVQVESTTISCEIDRAFLLQLVDGASVKSSIFSSEDSSGIDVITSSNVDIEGCNVHDVAGLGMYFSSASNLSVSTSSVSDSDGEGVYALNCPSMTFINNYITNTGDNGFHSEGAENLTLTDNNVEHADGYGFYHDDGENLILHRDTVSHATDDGIRVDVADDASIMDNEVTYSEGTGLSVSSSDRALIQGNVIDDCEGGLSVDSSTNVTIYDNHVSDVTQIGIDLYDMKTSVISGNSVDANAREGMTLDLLDDCNITDNALEGCGFYWEPDLAIGYYEHLFENNTVNGNDVYYGLHEEGQDIIADDWPQVFLINCTNMDIHDGTFNQITVPVELIHSDNCEIWNLVSTGNEYGLLIYQSENTSVYDVDITGLPYGHGIIAYYADGFQLVNSSIENYRAMEGHGLFLGFSDHTEVDGCKFDSNYVNLGIKSVFDMTISNNEILNAADDGIRTEARFMFEPISEYIRIVNNTILNATYGIYMDQANNITILENTIRYCSLTGVYYGSSEINALNVTSNTIENNRDGIWITNDAGSLVNNNTIRWNYRYGIYVDTPAIPDIYYNIIALNHEANGEDENAGTFWDDGVDTGNWWDDYNPPGAYDVDGDTQDRYPMQYLPTEPIIDQPADIYYAEGSTGNEIMWYAHDDYLSDWSVTIDGDTWDSNAYNYDNITVNVDGLEYGTHTAVLTVWDTEDNSASDTVLIHVYDGTKPTISNTPNTEAFVDGSEQTLSWKVSDLHPDTYTAYLDDEEWDSGSWSTGTLEINIDGMSEGEHTLKTVIRDIDGNRASDTVIVLVIDDDASPTIDSPADMAFIEGTTNNRVVWNPTDEYPDRFEVISNDSVLVEGSWGGSRIVVTVDNLEVGTHSLTLTVYDKSGNSVSDSVEVQVIPVSLPPEQAPEIPWMMIAIAAAGVGVVVVIGALFYMRKERTG
ncbi:MAG: right-handed parallel beta-helix repeat-containing protein [Candidatus Thorarchaeota archaeon]